MKKILIVLLTVVALTTSAQSADMSSFFTNIDFDSGITHIADGFDNVSEDIIGWNNYPSSPLSDSGVEGPGAWWGPYDNQAAFMATDDGAYNLSSYTIQQGDHFTIGYFAQWWDWTGDAGEWTVTLFYDDPANVIGTYVQSGLTGSWIEYSSPDFIVATSESVGGTLGILVQSTGGGIAQIDEIAITKVQLENNSPEDGATSISVVRTDPDNDLVFTVYDSAIVEADVYMSADDPNVPDVIANDLEIGVQGHDVVTMTVTLEDLTSDLSFQTTYYWKVVGYEPNSVSGLNDIEVSGEVWSFTTAPQDPKITLQPDSYVAVEAGEPNLVLTANGINGDLKWYKDGVAIDDTAGVYAGTTTGELVIYDVQLVDEGYYTMKVSNLGGESDESESARVMIHRQTSYYDFESTSIVDNNEVFLDSIDGYHAILMSEDSESVGMPTYVSDGNSISGLGSYLYLSNENSVTDPNGQYLQIYPGVVDYEDLTVTLWVQSTNVDIWQRIFDFGSGESAYMFIATDFGSNYDPRFAILVDSGTEQRLQPDLNSANWIGPGTGWHFVAVTISGDTGKVYVDGQWYASNTSMTYDPIDVGAVLNYIGKSQFDTDPEFSGYIDDLKIYNYARTNEQIAQDYMAVTGDASVCDVENNDMGDYDADGDCKISLPDFAEFAVRWLEADQFLPAE